MKSFCVLIPFFFLLFAYAQAQNEQDLAKDDAWYANEYFKKSFYSINRDLDKAQILADSSLFFYDKAGNEYGRELYKFLKATMERYRGNYAPATALYKEYEQAAIARKDTQMLGSVNYQLGLVTESLGDLEKAVAYQIQSIGYYNMLGDSSKMISNLNNLGSVHRKLKQYDKSREYYHTALALNIKSENLGGQADMYVNLGNLYAEQDKYELALDHYLKGKQLDSLTNFEWGLGYDYENIGSMYARQKEYARALVNYKQSLVIREKLGQKYELTQIHTRMGELYNETNRLKEAEDLLLKAKSLAEETNAAESKSEVYKALSTLYRKKGNYKTAMDYQDQYMTVKDSLLNQSTADRVSKLNVQFETKNKEQQIELLTTEKELTAAKLTAARRQIVGLAIGALLITAFLFTILRLYRKTQTQNTIISKALSEKEILLKEIHHRVKNNLQFISSLLGLQSEHVSDKIVLGALQEGQDRVQSMALIHQNLYQEDNLTGVDMKEYFVKLIRGLFDSYNIRPDKVKLKLEVENVHLDVDTVIPIGLIVNELVSNSLKYAFPENQDGLITVGLKEENTTLQLTVYDNGIGITPEQQKSLGESFGYRLVHVFTKQLHAKMNIVNDGGTSVHIEMKNYVKAQVETPSAQ